jgi:hypothetical protein
MIANSVFAKSAFMTDTESDRDFIERLVAHVGVSASEVAMRAGLAVSTLTRPLNHPVKYRLSKATIDKLRKTFPAFEDWAAEPAAPASTPTYVEVRVLPTFAGMGGGGTGDGDQSVALVPRSLIVDILRGKPDDFLLIDVRGDSMEPDFQHGDQILVDRRDISPAQPGPFAIWDHEGAEYVVKNLERVGKGRVRMFSTNPKYSPIDVLYQETRIIGRPVWFGRRL